MNADLKHSTNALVCCMQPDRNYGEGNRLLLGTFLTYDSPVQTAVRNDYRTRLCGVCSARVEHAGEISAVILNSAFTARHSQCQ